MRELRDRRKAREPHAVPNAGSTFKNPPNEFAGRLIEACGLKGQRVGGAEVSPVHANWLVNAESAHAKDMLALIEIVRAAVATKFGITLELEVKVVGEDVMSKFHGHSGSASSWAGPRRSARFRSTPARACCAALQEKGYDAVAIDWKNLSDDLGAQLRREKVDVAWIALHGTYGEDGCVQGSARVLWHPVHRLGRARLGASRWTRWRRDASSIRSRSSRRAGAAITAPPTPARIGFPLVVKPSSEGSSVGVSIVKTQAQLAAAIDERAKNASRRGARSRSTSRGARSTSACSTTRRSATSRFARPPSSTTTRPSTCATTRSISARRRSATAERRMLHDLARARAQGARLLGRDARRPHPRSRAAARSVSRSTRCRA